MSALELVSDKKTKTPIDKATGQKVQEVAYQNGIMVRVSGPNIILSPPLIVTEKDVDDICAGLDAGLSAV